MYTKEALRFFKIVIDKGNFDNPKKLTKPKVDDPGADDPGADDPLVDDLNAG